MTFDYMTLTNQISCIIEYVGMLYNHAVQLFIIIVVVVNIINNIVIIYYCSCWTH